MELPTFYGEILPVLSRAVDDDDDDTISVRPLEMKWEENCSSEILPQNISTIVIAHGAVACTFMESYYISSDGWNKAASLFETEADDDGDNLYPAQTKPLCTIYTNMTNPDKPNITCICDCYIQPEQIWPSIEKILSSIPHTTSQFVILSSTSVHEYKCAGSTKSSAPFVRSLCTGEALKHGNVLFPPLEQPNMAKGIPAAVMTYCEANNLPAYLYICFPDTMHLDTASVQCFKPILTSGLLPQPQEQEQEKALKQIINTAIKSSSGNYLYS